MTKPLIKPLSDGLLILPENPFVGLRQWIDDAKQAGALEPTAMTLATASREGVPSARIVLYKGSSDSSLGREAAEFFTNYQSQKSNDLSENPVAALVFHWNILRRQIRLEGTVEKVSTDESNRYFQSRARESQVGAWSSPQSQYLKDREELVTRVEATSARFGDGLIPCPSFWGGWKLTPSRFEFWEERPSRLHERFEMKFEGGDWVKRRLAP